MESTEPTMNHGIADRLVAFLAASSVVLGTASGCGDSATEPPPPAPDPSRPTMVTVTPATSQLTALGATVQLNAEVRDQNGLAMAGTTLTWVSNATAIATVDGTGLVTAVGNGTATITASAGPASGSAAVTVTQRVRASVDRPDEVAGWQLHAIYLLANDGADRELDVKGKVAQALDLALDLIFEQTGRQLRVDTYNDGITDVTFARHRLTEEELHQCNGLPCREESIFDEIDIGDPTNKVYLLFFDHSIKDPDSSFNRSLTADLGGSHAPGRSVNLPFGGLRPGLPWARGIAHELFHILGAVPEGAPHRADGAHVCDGPDLMSYCNPGVEVDFGRDDYYGHDIPGVWDTEDSPLWVDSPLPR